MNELGKAGQQHHRRSAGRPGLPKIPSANRDRSDTQKRANAIELGRLRGYLDAQIVQLNLALTRFCRCARGGVRDREPEYVRTAEELAEVTPRWPSYVISRGNSSKTGYAAPNEHGVATARWLRPGGWRTRG
jgi:hypothetical protein